MLVHTTYTYVPVSVVTELVDVKPVEAGSQAADLSTDLHRILQIDAKEVQSYVTNCVKVKKFHLPHLVRS